MDSSNYYKNPGLCIANHTNRRIREALRYILYKEGIIPDWKDPGLAP